MDNTVWSRAVVKITISMKNYPIVEEVVYYRGNMNVQQAYKWRWYFEYLAALVKVANPHRKVNLITIDDNDLLLGEEYKQKKIKTLLSARKGQLKKLQNTIIEDDLFGIKSAEHAEKIAKKKEEVEKLERGEFDGWVPSTYKNTIKKWINHETKRI